MKTTKQSLSTPIKMGVILGLMYCILIFCQNQFFYSNPIQFASTKLFCYLIILTGIFFAGYLSKKEMGGYISFPESLRAMLLAILILEIFYLIFSTLYVKYIDPGFFERLRTSWQAYFIKNNVPEDKIQESLDKFNEARNITMGGLIKSLGFSIIIDAVFAVIFSALIKKQPVVFESHNEN